MMPRKRLKPQWARDGLATMAGLFLVAGLVVAGDGGIKLLEAAVVLAILSEAYAIDE